MRRSLRSMRPLALGLHRDQLGQQNDGPAPGRETHVNLDCLSNISESFQSRERDSNWRYARSARGDSVPIPNK